MIHAFEVYPKWKPEWATTINHTSLNKAKTEYLAINELDSDQYIHLRGRKVGQAATSDAFKRVAAMRNVRKVYCGMRVVFDGKEGIITGFDAGCNFEVYFPATGEVDTCHPHYLMRYFNESGEVVYDYSEK